MFIWGPYGWCHFCRSQRVSSSPAWQWVPSWDGWSASAWSSWSCELSWVCWPGFGGESFLVVLKYGRACRVGKSGKSQNWMPACWVLYRWWKNAQLRLKHQKMYSLSISISACKMSRPANKIFFWSCSVSACTAVHFDANPFPCYLMRKRKTGFKDFKFQTLSAGFEWWRAW